MLLIVYLKITSLKTYPSESDIGNQGIHKSIIKADPNRIIFSSGVFGTSWVIDATAKFLKSIKLTTVYTSKSNINLMS